MEALKKYVFPLEQEGFKVNLVISYEFLGFVERDGPSDVLMSHKKGYVEAQLLVEVGCYQELREIFGEERS